MWLHITGSGRWPSENEANVKSHCDSAIMVNGINMLHLRKKKLALQAGMGGTLPSTDTY